MKSALIIALFFLACAVPVLLGVVILKLTERLGWKYTRAKAIRASVEKSVGNFVVSVLLVLLPLAVAVGFIWIIVKTIKWAWYS
jgi:accessory gene regulator protein AgrB